MSSMTNPRGPLPARVYWIRRGIVLAVALLLIFGLGKVVSMMTGGDPNAGKAVTAAQNTDAQNTDSPNSSANASASASPSGTLSASTDPSPGPSKKPRAALAASAPQGTCRDAEVVVTPKISKADGGSAITIPMVLTTVDEACTFKVSSKSVVVKITSGSDRIWSSQDCPAAIPDTDVVVRPEGEKKARVVLEWSGRRSAEDCAKGTEWAKLGSYHVIAASFGGTPSDVQFEVTKPPRPTVTRTAKPKPKATATTATEPGREN